MANKPYNKRKIRKLGRIANDDSGSYYITIPIELIKKLGWKENQNLVVRKYKGRPKIVVEDKK